MRTFKSYDLDQPYLLPPDVRAWLPEGHLALFVSDVVEALDLSAILGEYERGDGRGYPPYHPVMMVKLLVYGYCTGKTSSRKIERATWEDVPYRVLSGNQQPDHDSIAEFRRRHLKALAGLFVQVLNLCREAGLVKLGHVSVDGSKVKANASKHKAMSYQRMGETEERLMKEVEALLAEAEATDQEEDARYGKGKRGDELPDELARRETRLKKIREAKAALEAEAKAKAQAQAQEARKRIEERERQEVETGKKRGGTPPRIPDPGQAVPEPKAQKNFTDPESRIMLDGATKSFQQSYNTQIVVDATAPVRRLESGVRSTRRGLRPRSCSRSAARGRTMSSGLQSPDSGLEPGGVSPTGSIVATADAGYFSEQAVTDERLDEVDLYVATGRERKAALTPIGRESNGQPVSPRRALLDPEEMPQSEVSDRKPPGPSAIQQMREKLAADQGKAIYKRRKAVVEPVFGQIKQARGFRQFSFRGLTQVTAEWDLVAWTHNLLKLFRSGWNPGPLGRTIARVQQTMTGGL